MENIRDFYMRPESDPKFRPDQIEVYNEIEASINQVKMTLLTRKGEVLGEPNFGINPEQYLFDFENDPFLIAGDAETQISQFVTESKKRKIGVTPSYTLDEKDNKIYALQIYIDGYRSPFAILYDQ